MTMCGLSSGKRPAARALALSLALLATVPAGAATLLGLIDTGELFSSGDNGVTWSALSTLPVHDAVALAARLSSADLFLASRSGSIYRSTDAGASWTAVGALAASDVADMAIRPDGALLVLTATGSLYRSTDLGASFTGLAALTGSNFTGLTFTTPADKYYALSRTGEVYESADGGATWTPKGALAVSDAEKIRAVSSALYVLTGAGDIFRSDDAGASWTAVGTLSQVGMRGLVRNGVGLAAATKEGHVATSADGATWTWRGSMNQLALTGLATDEPATTDVEPGPGAGRFVTAPYPNPSTGALALAVSLEREQAVRLVLYDLGGRRVAERASQRLGAGRQVLEWESGVRRPGLYFLEIEIGSTFSATRRWVVMR